MTARAKSGEVGPDTETVPDRSQVSDQEVQDLASQRHALNVLITEYDWQRALEAVRLEGLDSVSDVVRRALRKYLDEHPAAELFDEAALHSLKFELMRQKRRRPYARAANDSS
jgi:Arc/MetJ-type ribon-helix-helix transcriptional regulator